MEIADAQADSRRAYVGGGPGVMISGVVWTAAGVARHLGDTREAFAVLFLGGMLIFPLSALVSLSLFRRGKAAPDNKLGVAALGSTIAMIGGLFAAWLFMPFRAAFVFPLAAIAVGTHYATFRVVYGDPLFFFLAGLVTCTGVAGIYLPAFGGAELIFAVAAIELVSGVILTSRALTP